MGDIMTSITFAAKLSDHGLAVWVAVTTLAGGYQTMFWMAERAGLIGVSGLTLYQGVVNFRVASSANLFWLCSGKGDVQRIMRVGVTAQTIFVLDVGTVTRIVMTIETGRDFAMDIMTGGTCNLGVVLRVCLGDDLIDLGVTWILVAGAAIFLRSVARIGYYHRFMGSSVTGHTNLWFNSNQMVRHSAFLAVAAQTAWDKAVFSVAIVAGHVCVLTWEVCQLLWRSTVAIRTLILLDARQSQRCVGIRVTVAAGLSIFFFAVWVAMTISTFRHCFCILDLAWSKGVVNFVAECTLKLVTVA